MRIDIMTLFPEMFENVLFNSIIGRACNKGIIDIKLHQIRDYTENKQKQVDDYPYGGGWGCVMMAQPLKSCLDSIKSEYQSKNSRVIYLSPQGKTFNQEEAKRLKDNYDQLILVCGHYEGIDERFIEKCVDEELSIGDFVLTGGEIAAMAVTDCVCRMIPGVLSNEECFTGESHWDGLLEYPQYTRPEVWEEMSVPEVLIEGNAKRIDAWRHMQQLKRTYSKRPDMFVKLNLTEEEKKLAAFPDLQLSFRQAEINDIDKIMDIVADARAYLKSNNVDQWQGEYPQQEDFIEDINKCECYVILNDDDVAAVFTVAEGIVEEYSSITDGKWTNDDCIYCTLHRVAVSDKYRHKGISHEIIRRAEEITKSKGIRYLRADTHKKNKPMQMLLRSCNFKYRGNVLVGLEIGHDSNRQAYEKIIK